MSTEKLAFHDLQWCLRRCPRLLLVAMKKHGAKIIVAGGYIRSCIANEHINDVDVFMPSLLEAEGLAMELCDGDQKRVHKTENALTLRGFSIPIQIIHRWTFTNPSDCIKSFDFTIARSAFWNTGDVGKEGEPGHRKGEWLSECDASFYPDLAGKRLRYTEPVRIEEAGGSMLRVLKFYQRGYRIPLDSLGAVIARLMSGVENWDEWRLVDGKIDERHLGKVLSGLLREVDPNIDPSHIAHLPSETEQDKAAEEGSP